MFIDQEGNKYTGGYFSKGRIFGDKVKVEYVSGNTYMGQMKEGKLSG